MKDKNFKLRGGAKPEGGSSIPVKKKYLIYPGTVHSQYDWDRHYVNGGDIMRLYGVDRKECIIVNTGDETRGLVGTFIKLIPDCTGAYMISDCGRVELT